MNYVPFLDSFKELQIRNKKFYCQPLVNDGTTLMCISIEGEEVVLNYKDASGYDGKCFLFNGFSWILLVSPSLLYIHIYLKAFAFAKGRRLPHDSCFPIAKGAFSLGGNKLSAVFAEDECVSGDGRHYYSHSTPFVFGSSVARR